MDEHDKEFETFLQQFQLRQHRGFPAEAPVEIAWRRHRRPWVVAAVAAVILAAISLPVVRHFMNPVLPGATVESAGDSVYSAGQVIAAGNAIHSGGFETLFLRLEDGTQVEMRAQSRIVLEAAEDGTRVRLNSGSILVRAAKQRDEHLYVNTKDTAVSGVGTLFLVEALPQGSRVAVLEGEVEVRLGTEVQRLVMGQQVASNSEIAVVSIEKLIAWSSRAEPQDLLVGERSATTESEKTTSPKEASEEPVPPVPGTRSVSSSPPTTQPQQPAEPQPPQEPPRPAPGPEQQEQSDAAGKALVDEKCVSCHGVDLITGKQANKVEWTGIIDRMKSYGAPLDDKQTGTLLDYLLKHYGPKDATPPAPPVPAPGASASADAGKKTLTDSCANCHDLDLVIGRTGSESEWQEVVDRMNARGAGVAENDVSALVRYLAKTYPNKK